MKGPELSWETGYVLKNGGMKKQAGGQASQAKKFPLHSEKAQCGCGSKCESGTSPPALHLPEGAAGLAKALQKEQQLNRNWALVLGSQISGAEPAAQCLQTPGTPAPRWC